MNINYKEFCESVFNTEVEKEKLNNVTLKILPISIINCSGYMIPNIKKSEYKIIINAIVRSSPDISIRFLSKILKP